MPTSAHEYQTRELSLPGVIQVNPTRFIDERGYFAEIYNAELFREIGITTHFVQDAVSYSTEHVLRGLHYQRSPHAQDKLVRCASGTILDVAADVDPRSVTYGRHVMVELSGESQSMLYIPGQYAHGFVVTTGPAIVEYKLSDKHHPELAGGVMFNDPVLGIEWPVSEPIISAKDRSWDLLPN